MARPHDRAHVPDSQRAHPSRHAKVPQGVLLDVDGTLLDSNHQHARAWAEALAEADVLVPEATLYKMIGKGGDKILPQVAHLDDESPRGKAIKNRCRAIFRERYLHTCVPFPKARDLVARMKDQGLAIIVATSAAKEELTALLHVAGVHDLIEDATTSSEAKRSKPDPDIVTAAAEKSGLSNDVLIMVGDTPYDIEAAARAGIRAVGLCSGGWSELELAGAVAVYADAADLLHRYDESPFGRARQDASERSQRSAERKRERSKADH